MLHDVASIGCPGVLYNKGINYASFPKLALV